MLCIAPTARISGLADIEDSVRGSRIVIEDDVTIDAFVKIKPAGGSGDLLIGRGSVINSGCVLYTGNGIRIGRNVLIAANCTLAPTNHTFADCERPIRDQGFQPSRGGIVIGDDVWVGANSALVDGATIGMGAVIGAASLVRGTLPEYLPGIRHTGYRPGMAEAARPRPRCYGRVRPANPNMMASATGATHSDVRGITAVHVTRNGSNQPRQTASPA